MSTRQPSALRRSFLAAAAALPMVVGAGLVQALPTGGVVTGTSGGSVTIAGFGQFMAVSSQAHRALIDWKTFSVGAGETLNFNVPDKNAIIVNRQMTGGLSNINGAITSTFPGASPNAPRQTGGNIWIINPNGVVFGPNAVVNVGGLLATTANLTNDNTFLHAEDTDPISFSGGPIGSAVAIDNGAHLTVNDGAALFVADIVSAGGIVQGAGTFSTGTQVLYGGAKAYTIRFSEAPPDPLRATDLGLFDFTIDQGGSEISYGIGAATTAGQVILALRGDPAVLDGGGGCGECSTELAATQTDATIDVTSGTIKATGAGANALMIVGDDIAGGAAAGNALDSRALVLIGRTTTESPAPVLTSAGGMRLSGDGVIAGALDDVAVDFKVKGASKIFANYVELNNIGGQIAPDIDTGPNLDSPPQLTTAVQVTDQYHASTLGDVTTQGTIDIEGLVGAKTGNLTGGAGVTVLTGGPMHLGDVNAADGAVVLTSADTLSAGAVGGQSVAATAGGAVAFTRLSDTPEVNLDAGLKIDGAVNATAGAVDVNATGKVDLVGAVNATGAVNVTAGGSMTVADITAGGAETLLGGAAVTTGLLTAPTTVDVEATDALKLDGVKAGSLFARAGIFTGGQPGAAQSLTVTGSVNVQTGAVFKATGLFHNEAPIAVLAANTPARGSGVPLTTVLEVDSTDANIGAPIAIHDASGGTAAIVLNSLNPNGVAVGNGLSDTAGLYNLSGAEVSKLSADGVLVLASDANSLRVGNLSIDASRTPVFQVGVSPGSTEGGTVAAFADATAASEISVEGTVAGLGAPTFMAGGSAIGVGGGLQTVSYTPDRVIVSGAIGTGGSPFGEVDLVAHTDVLIGSAAFVDAFDAASDPTTLPSDVYQAGFGGVPTGHVFIDAGVVQLGASRAIAQQNTRPKGGGLTVTKTLAINDSPVRVDLFGYVPNADGILVNGPPAALSPNILINGTPPDPHSYLMNGCRIGDATDCQSPPPPPPPVLPITTINGSTRPPTPQEFPPVQTFSIYPWDTGALIVLPSAKRQSDDPTKSGLQTVSGIANEDVWPTDSKDRCPPMRTKGSGAPPQNNQTCQDQ